MMVTSADTYRGASCGRKVCGPRWYQYGTAYLYTEYICLPIIFPAQYPIRYIAATVVFFVYPATLLLMRLSSATNGVGLACVKQCNDEYHADHSGAKPNHGDKNSVTVLVTRPATGDKEDDFDDTTWRAIEKRLFRCIAEAYN
jgi:hypothetical protein